MSAEKYAAIEAAAAFGCVSRGWVNITRKESVLAGQDATWYATDTSGYLNIERTGPEHAPGSGSTTSLYVVRFEHNEAGRLVPQSIAWTSGFIDRTDGFETSGVNDSVHTLPMYLVSYTACPKGPHGEPAQLEVSLETGEFPAQSIKTVALRTLVLSPAPWTSILIPSDAVDMRHGGSFGNTPWQFEGRVFRLRAARKGQDFTHEHDH